MCAESSTMSQSSPLVLVALAATDSTFCKLSKTMLEAIKEAIGCWLMLAAKALVTTVVEAAAAAVCPFADCELFARIRAPNTLCAPSMMRLKWPSSSG